MKRALQFGCLFAFAAVTACTFRVISIEGEAPDLAGAPEEDLAAPSEDLNMPAEDLTFADLTAPPDLATSPDLQVVGSLMVTRASYSGNVNLTSEGTLDWAHWGLGGAGGLNRKNRGASTQPLINVALDGTLTQWPAFTATFSWSDGAPTATESGTATGVYINKNGGGFTFTVPASTTPATLRLYLVVYDGTGSFNASLSDGSAASFSDTITTANLQAVYARYTLVFRAAAAAQTLTATFTIGNAGTVDVQAATLF